MSSALIDIGAVVAEVTIGIAVGVMLAKATFAAAHAKILHRLADEYALLAKRHKALDELYRRCAMSAERGNLWK